MTDINEDRKISTKPDVGIHESMLSKEEAKEKGLVKFGKRWLTRKEKRAYIYIRILSIIFIIAAVVSSILEIVRFSKVGLRASPVTLANHIATFFSFLIGGTIAIGLLKFKKWARTAILILYTIGTLLLIISDYLLNEPYLGAIKWPFIRFILFLIIIAVLTNSTANRIFKVSFPSLKPSFFILISLYIGFCVVFIGYYSLKSKDYQIIFEVKEGVKEGTSSIDITHLKETVEKRISYIGLPFWLREIKTQNSDKICIGLVRPKKIILERLKQIITLQSRLELKLVEKGPAQNEEDLLKEFGGETPNHMELVKAKYAQENYYLVRKEAVISRKDLKSTRRILNERNNPALGFNLNSDAAKKFYKFTSENKGRALAIIFNGELLAAPIIQNAVSESVMISGEFTIEEAEYLAFMLRAPDFPYQLELIYEGAKKDR